MPLKYGYILPCRTPVYAPMSLSEGRQLQMNEFERNSLAALKSFISMSLEVLGMWKILCDHQFHIVLQVRFKFFTIPLRKSFSFESVNVAYIDICVLFCLF